MTQEEKEDSIKGLILHSVHKVIEDTKHDTSSIENLLAFSSEITEMVFKRLKMIDLIKIDNTVQ